MLTNKTPEDLIKEGVKSSLWFDDVSENQQEEIAILAEKDYEAWHGVGDLPIDSCSHLEMTDEKHGKEEEDLNNYLDMGKDVVHKHEDEDIDEEVQIDEVQRLFKRGLVLSKSVTTF